MNSDLLNRPLELKILRDCCCTAACHTRQLSPVSAHSVACKAHTSTQIDISQKLWKTWTIRKKEMMVTETLHGALKSIILSTVCSLEWEAECWQKVMCLETAGKCDRIMLFPHYVIYYYIQSNCFLFSPLCSLKSIHKDIGVFLYTLSQIISH